MALVERSGLFSFGVFKCMVYDYNFWENMTYLLGGVVVAGILAAIAQIISIRMLTSGSTKFRICMKKEGKDGREEASNNH